MLAGNTFPFSEVSLRKRARFLRSQITSKHQGRVCGTVALLPEPLHFLTSHAAIGFLGAQLTVSIGTISTVDYPQEDTQGQLDRIIVQLENVGLPALANAIDFGRVELRIEGNI